ncbi:GGDEF domain-containing protein [Paludibacterium purpuratum]|uniref:diguanylate cyclase n=1 Tax=Paludibacterium purpuratum TaxID=1144873 RepID=A0A4R7BBU1_9NEIS|nr:GGDEF domain-containing protein [Paludibacterium purpuratum]TDR81572.1 diguanylate cyclase (GGDEF)-like protein [Paludibacterium purpuratum]
MRIANLLWQWLLGLLPGEVEPNETGWLVSPRLHMPLIVFRRAQMILNRVRLFASLFAVLTPLWVLVDVATFPMALWLRLAALRLVATCAFVALVLLLPQHGRLRHAYRAMIALFAIPTVFYLVSHLLLTQQHLHGSAAAISAGYAFLPFVLLAGLAIFPLTLIETAFFSLAVLGANMVAYAFNWGEVSLPSFGAQLWLLMLLAGVASLASLSQLAFIIALVNQTIHDPLTGMFSRRSGEELLELQQSYALRHNTPLSIAFVDLDCFKRINDDFGHEAGDKVLKQVNRAIGRNLRHGDILIRWGGEEFLLVMPNTDKTQARQALLRVLESGLGKRPDGDTLTCSIGLAERHADRECGWRALVDMADVRMYRAKREGGNRLVTEVEEEPVMNRPLVTP